MTASPTSEASRIQVPDSRAEIPFFRYFANFVPGMLTQPQLLNSPKAVVIYTTIFTRNALQVTLVEFPENLQRLFLYWLEFLIRMQIENNAADFRKHSDHYVFEEVTVHMGMCVIFHDSII